MKINPTISGSKRSFSGMHLKQKIVKFLNNAFLEAAYEMQYAHTGEVIIHITCYPETCVIVKNNEKLHKG